jgi:transposase
LRRHGAKGWCLSCREPVPRARSGFAARAVELLLAGRTPRGLAESLGASEQTLRDWRRQARLDRGERDDGPSSDEREELRRLRRENARLEQERDILRRATARFAGETEIR